MDSDLKWLAENVHEWDDRFDMICKSDLSFSFGPEWFNSKYFNGKDGYTRAQWQAARDELIGKPDQPTKWRGPEDGLPPVGLICESHLLGLDWEIGRIAYIGRNLIVWESDSGNEYATRPDDRWFRKLRTEEDKAVEDMLALDCDPHEGMLSREDFCRKLYRENYRKQELK